MRRQFFSLLNSRSITFRQRYFTRSCGAGVRRLALAGMTASTGSGDLLADGIGIIAAVGEERFDAVTDHPEERRKALNVVSLAGRQHEAEWEASGVASGVEFGGEASPRSAEPLCLLSPLFKPTAQ